MGNQASASTAKPSSLRQEGGRLDYLDSRYQPTQLLPNSPQRVLDVTTKEADNCVSRGHFMLNGSRTEYCGQWRAPPRRRHQPPLNGRNVDPEYRWMNEGNIMSWNAETSATIRLPNGQFSRYEKLTCQSLTRLNRQEIRIHQAATGSLSYTRSSIGRSRTGFLPGGGRRIQFPGGSTVSELHVSCS